MTITTPFSFIGPEVSATGGDATATNQATIIAHLTDIKGSGWVASDNLAEIAEDVAGLNGASPLDSAQSQAACAAAIVAAEPISANLTQIQGHTLSGTGAQIADAFETFFDVAAPLSMEASETLLRLAASAVGAVDVTDNGNGTLTLSIKDTDGSTEVRNLTYTLATGQRVQNP